MKNYVETGRFALVFLGIIACNGLALHAAHGSDSDQVVCVDVCSSVVDQTGRACHISNAQVSGACDENAAMDSPRKENFGLRTKRDTSYNFCFRSHNDQQTDAFYLAAVRTYHQFYSFSCKSFPLRT